MREIKQSDTAKVKYVYMVLSIDHITPATGKTVTANLSKNGAAFGAAAGAITELSNGFYSVAGNATDNGTLGPMALYATATGCDPFQDEYMVVSYDPFDATRLGLLSLPNANAEAAGGMYTRGTGAGQINQPSNGLIDVSLKAILNTVLTETAGQLAAGFKKVFDVLAPVFTAASVNQTGDNYARIGAPAGASVSADVAAVSAKLPALVGGRVDASVGAMAPNTLTASALATDAVTEIQTGLATSANQATINGNVLAIPTNPLLANDSRVSHLDADISSRSTYAGGAVASVTGSVGSVATGGIAAASFAAGAIDNAAIATDAIGAAEVSAAAVTKIQNGLMTSGAYTAPDNSGIGTASAAAVSAAASAASAASSSASAAASAATVLSRIPGTVAAQSGDSFALIGATGSGLTSLAQASTLTDVQTDVDELQTTIGAPIHGSIALDIAAGGGGGSGDTSTFSGAAKTEIDAIKAKTDTIGSGSYTVVSPTSRNSDGTTRLYVICGDVYDTDTQVVTIVPPSGSPDLTGAIVYLVLPTGGGTPVSITATTVTNSLITWHIPAASSAGVHGKTYDVYALLAGTLHKTTLIVQGPLTVYTPQVVS